MNRECAISCVSMVGGVRAIVCGLVVVAENVCEENRIMRKNGDACYIFIFIGKYEEIMKSFRCFDRYIQFGLRFACSRRFGTTT